VNRTNCTFLSLAVAFAVAGCNPGSGIPGGALMDQVQLVELEPAGNGAKRFEARLVADDRYAYQDHSTALLMSMSGDRCDQGGFSLEAGGDHFIQDAARPEDGQLLTMQFTCSLDRLPNHQAVAPGSPHFGAMPGPEGADTKSGWTSGAEKPIAMANRLIGDQVREAYTEDCGEKPMVIERIDTGTEWVAPAGTERAGGTQSPAGRARMHVALAFRCLEPPSTGDD
jgi:hypothetical protein